MTDLDELKAWLTATIPALLAEPMVPGAAETAIGELPLDRFPQLRSLGELTDPGPTWAFSLETLVAGLRAQLAVRAG